jgi:hypothetical protein
VQLRVAGPQTAALQEVWEDAHNVYIFLEACLGEEACFISLIRIVLRRLPYSEWSRSRGRSIAHYVARIDGGIYLKNSGRVPHLSSAHMQLC